MDAGTTRNYFCQLCLRIPMCDTYLVAGIGATNATSYKQLSFSRNRERANMNVRRIAPVLSSAKCPRFTRLTRFNWRRYRTRLLGFVRKTLGAGKSRFYDEDDLVQITFENFFDGIADGRIDDWGRRDPWPLLAVIARRKMVDCFHYEHRRKRGGGRVQNESSLPRTNGDASDNALSNLVVDPVSPAADVVWHERYGNLLDKLNDSSLRRVAALKVDGYKNEEIAEMLNCSRATVCRRLSTIRELWRDDFKEELASPARSRRRQRASAR
jgi:RNA polymerase sigma factor (sigma-70 family)